MRGAPLLSRRINRGGERWKEVKEKPKRPPQFRRRVTGGLSDEFGAKLGEGSCRKLRNSRVCQKGKEPSPRMRKPRENELWVTEKRRKRALPVQRWEGLRGAFKAKSNVYVRGHAGEKVPQGRYKGSVLWRLTSIQRTCRLRHPVTVFPERQAQYGSEE